MPSASDELRQKFMTPGDIDGMNTAHAIIRAVGGRSNGGDVQLLPRYRVGVVADAVDFLIQEWDYSFTELSEVSRDQLE